METIQIKAVSQLDEYAVANGHYKTELPAAKNQLPAPNELDGSPELLIELSQKNDDKYTSKRFKFSGFTANVYTLLQKISNKIVDIDAAIASLSESTSDLYEQLKQRVDALEETVNSNYEYLNGRIDTTNSNVTALASRVTTAEGNINSLVSRMGTAEGNIRNFASDLATAQTDISNVASRMGTAESNIGTLTTGLANAQGSINSILNGNCDKYLRLADVPQQTVSGAVKFANSTSFDVAINGNLNGTAEHAKWS